MRERGFDLRVIKSFELFRILLSITYSFYQINNISKEIYIFG
jgi:hypothetical protein